MKKRDRWTDRSSTSTSTEVTCTATDNTEAFARMKYAEKRKCRLANLNKDFQMFLSVDYFFQMYKTIVNALYQEPLEDEASLWDQYLMYESYVLSPCGKLASRKW